MDKINKLNNVIEILRSGSGRGKDPLNKPQRSSARTDSAAADTDPPQTRSVEELKRRLTSKLKQLDKNQPDFEHRAQTAIVETIVTWEFSDKLLDDPEFPFVIKQLCDNFISNHAVGAKLSSLIDDLV